MSGQNNLWPCVSLLCKRHHAGNKLPGLYEFVRKGDPPVMGITKLAGGVTEESLRRPRMKGENHPTVPNVENTAKRIPATSGT